jgi:hypothetical protein
VWDSGERAIFVAEHLDYLDHIHLATLRHQGEGSIRHVNDLIDTNTNITDNPPDQTDPCPPWASPSTYLSRVAS